MLVLSISTDTLRVLSYHILVYVYDLSVVVVISDVQKKRQQKYLGDHLTRRWGTR